MPRRAVAIATVVLSALTLGLAACNDGEGGGEEPTSPTAPTAVDATGTEAPPAATSTPGTPPNIRDVDLTMEEGLRSFLMDSNGQVDPGRIMYADVTNDGIEDAVVPVSSGGEGGDIAAFVFGATSQGVEELQRILPASGRLKVSVERGDLIVEEPVFAPGDPMCCPSELQRTTYRWDGSALSQEEQETVPAEGG